MKRQWRVSCAKLSIIAIPIVLVSLLLLPGNVFSQSLQGNRTEHYTNEMIQKLSKKYLEEADEFLEKKARKTFATEHYAIISDIEKQEALQCLALILEDFRKGYCSIFEQSFPLRKTDYPTYIVVFKSQAGFKFFGSRVGLNRADGFYLSGTSIIATHFMHASAREFMSVIMHETVHQLNDHLLYSWNVRKTLWFNEGLANYFGHMKLRNDGTLIAGEIDWSIFHVEALIASVKRARNSKSFVKLEELVSCSDPEKFLGQDTQLYYGESWLFVRFLLHYDNGRYRRSLAGYIQYEIEGKGGLESFKKFFGGDLDQLEREFKKYISRL